MAELEIKESRHGDVTVLTARGKVTLGEASASLRQTMNCLLAEGRTKIVLDLTAVTYFDSSGLGEFVSSITRVNKAGGRIWFLNSPEGAFASFIDWHPIGFLFPTAWSLEGALAGAEAELLETVCPVHGCGAPVVGGEPPAYHQFKCARCRASFQILPLEPSPEAGLRAAVKRLWLPTYEGEQVILTPGPQTLIQLKGRLDLFAAEVLEKAWRSAPPPRRVLFGVSGDASQAGLAVLRELCAAGREDGRGVVYASSMSNEPEHDFGLPVYRDRGEAEAALGPAPDADAGALILQLKKADA